MIQNSASQHAETEHDDRSDPRTVAKLVAFIELLGQSSLGSPQARAAREAGINALCTTDAERRPGPTDPLVVEAEMLDAERSAQQGDEQAARIACRSVLNEPVTDRTWALQCKAATYLPDAEHLASLLRIAKSGYLPAAETIVQLVRRRFNQLLSIRLQDATVDAAELELANAVRRWIPSISLGEADGALNELLRRWLGDGVADAILAEEKLCVRLKAELTRTDQAKTTQTGEAGMTARSGDPHRSARGGQAAGTRPYPATPAASIVPDDELSALTARELEVLTELAGGDTNREIAQRLFLTEKTVGAHIRSIYTKLGVHSRRQASEVLRLNSSRNTVEVPTGVQQGELFPDPLLGEGPDGLPDPHVGFRGTTACQVVGITNRQLDYWRRTGLVVPSIRGAAGSGSERLYSFKDVLVLKVVKQLLDAGVPLQNIRVAVEPLRRHGIRDLSGITLFSDGNNIQECAEPEEAVDLMRGGQGVFGIAVGGAIKEISTTIKDFPMERADAPAPEESIEPGGSKAAAF